MAVGTAAARLGWHRSVQEVPMAHAWIVRSLRAEGYEELALERGIVAVGWGQTGDLSGLTNLDAIRDAVRAAFPFVAQDSIESYARQLYDFRSGIADGDGVLLLRRRSPNVAVGAVVGAYNYRWDVGPDIHHTRDVRWIQQDLPRAVLERVLLDLQPLTMLVLAEEDGVIDLVASATPGALADMPPARPAVPEDQQPIVTLQRNLSYARTLASAGQSLADLKVGAFEVTDVFRAAWVQAVAALDHWVRQEVRARMLRLASTSAGPKPAGFMAFEVPLGEVEDLVRDRTSLPDVLDRHLNRTRGHLSYQSADKIREAFELVSDVRDFWNRVARMLSEGEGDGITVTGAEVKARLASIARRRNKIAHESDEDPEQPSSKRRIEAAGVTETIDFIDQLAGAIRAVLDVPAVPGGKLSERRPS
jgi:hypothetical protein